jgi:hypothetical protein
MKPLKSVMNQLRSQMNLPVFLMADPKGNILYSADRSKGDANLKSFGPFKRALKGEQIITAARSADGWGLRAIVPFYAFDKSLPRAFCFSEAGSMTISRKRSPRKPAARS